MSLAADDPRHGTDNGYNNLKCRCDACKAAHAVVMKRVRAVRLARQIPDHVHGTYNGYTNYKCRCDDCAEAAHRYVGSPGYTAVRLLFAAIRRRERAEELATRKDRRRRRLGHGRAGTHPNLGVERLIREVLVETLREPMTSPALDRYFARLTSPALDRYFARLTS